MNIFGHMLMIAWLPIVLLMFALIRDRRRAVILSYMIGWMFLPFAGYSFSGLPDYNKFTATSFSVMLGVVLFDAERLFRLRPAWYDLPMVIWCLCPFASSITNGLGPYDGLSAVFTQFAYWGIPYVIGRAYIGSREGLAELATALFVGALVYFPLVLIESRMSAQIHKWVYGIPTRASWEQISIFGPLRWKSSVFMDSALALTVFMGTAALVGYWLHASGRLKRWWGVSMVYIVPILLAGAVLGKAMTGVGLMVLGIGVLYGIKLVKRPIPLLCLLLISPTYITLRASGIWTGEDLATFIDENISERRGGSLRFRLENEEVLVPHALEQPVFGWGRWGRSRVYNDEGRDTSVVDGMWVLAIGESGLVGLISLYGVMLLPAVVLVFRQPARFWLHPDYAPAVALSVVLVLYSIDCLLNAMLNPLFLIAAGGVIGLPAMGRAAPRQRRPIPAERMMARPRPVTHPIVH